MSKRAKYRLIDHTPPIPEANYYEYQDFEFPYANIGEFPLHGKRGIERFLPLLPVSDIPAALARGVGNTSVTRLHNMGTKLDLQNLWVKHEETNPTGCFKDRESMLIIASALENSVRKVVIVSSGNAALSTAAYAQKAGIDCVCYIPEKTSEEKKNLIRLFGASLVTIPGFYEDVYRYVVDAKVDGWNVTAG